MSVRRLTIACVVSIAASMAPTTGGAQLISPGRLSTPHTELEGLRNCTSCHQLGRSGVSAERCLECHQPVAARINASRGYHATVDADDCASCHQEHLGTDFDLVRLDEASFDHTDVGYELRLSHAEAGCRDCHRADHVRDSGVVTLEGERGALDRTFLGLTTDCASCHGAESPHGNQFAGQACADCHDTGRWEALPAFDHSGTAFPLRGLHAEVGCADCHGSGEDATYRGVAHETCNSCHTDPHRGAMAGTCSGCHDERGWHELRSGSIDASFDHTRTSFALRGAHAVADCSACHRTGNPPRSELVEISYRSGTAGRAYPLPIASSCSSCHVDRHAAATSAGRWLECTTCHGETHWAPSEFGLARHDDTSFPLTGGHAATACVACHTETVDGRNRFVFARDVAGCVDCHAQDDPHEGRYAAFRCESCHTTSAFDDATFDHAAYTTPGQRCADCHAALDPHGAQFEGTDCAECHQTGSFAIDTFDHSGTAFPLDGAHDDAECAACHTTDGTGTAAFVRYRPIGSECTDCHGGDPMRLHTLWVPALLLLVAHAPRVAAQQDGSLHGRLPDGLTCLSCHTTSAWTPTRTDLAFDHADTGFPLDGRHAQVTCVDCHGLVFSQLDRLHDCETCHVDIHRGTITAACVGCHSTTSFAVLNRGLVHPADFPLEGAHLQTSCESCHVDDVGGAYRPVDRECAACHRDEYMSTALVNHQALGFSLDCTECHSPLDFRDVVFDHMTASNGFELIGGHAGIECTTCHNGPGGDVGFDAAGPEDCYSCHAAEYDREHGGQGFPTDCRACHNTFDWQSGFAHTFEIFRGPHASEWNTCADCHEVPGDFGSFSCFGCHSQRDMDDHHREVNGYLYDSPTCLGCHPTGRGDN